MSLLKEPLLHFAVAGTLLFGAYAWLNEGQVPTGAAEPVRVGEGDVAWIKQTWSSKWLREPTADELQGLIDEFVNEQLLAREAAELGLGEDDTIVRRRLAQKLRFLVEDTAQLAEPEGQELRTFYAANTARYATPAKVSFEQRYFNPDRRTDAPADAATALAELSTGGDNDIAAGDRLLVGDRFAEIDEQAVSSLFGADFARDVFALEPGGWRGPVRSGYGLHLVRVQRVEPGQVRPFESVRDAVLVEWRNEKQSALARDYLARLREKYGVELDGSAAAALDSDPAAKVTGQPAAQVAVR